MLASLRWRSHHAMLASKTTIAATEWIARSTSHPSAAIAATTARRSRFRM
jgi:hypothetical protein